MPKRHGKNAETSFETRRRCLEAGAELFFTRQKREDLFHQLDVEDVANHAGITRGGFYYHWDTKDDFEADLVEYLLSEGDIFEEDFRRLRREVESTGGLDPLSAIARTAAVDISTVDSSKVWAAMELLAIGYTKHVDKYAAIAREGYRGIDEATWSDVYGQVMARARRTPRPPFTGPEIGMVLQALVEGTGIRHLFDRGLLSDPSRLTAEAMHNEYGAYPLAAAALLGIFTKPAEGGDDRTVAEVISDMFGDADASAGG